MTKLERVVDLSTRLHGARELAARLEAQLDALLDGEKEESTDVGDKHAEMGGGAVVDRRALIAKRAVNAGPGKPSPMRDQVIAAAKLGLAPAEISKKVGIPPRQVSTHIWKARGLGLLPKAEAAK